MKNVEKGYFNDRPLHHHPSARARKYHPLKTLSDVFVVDYDDFKVMHARNVQDIIRDRHILVVKCPTKDEGFSRESFKRFINLHKIIELHGK